MTAKNANRLQSTLAVRAWCLLAAALCVLAGLACKAYSGPAAEWVRNWGPGSVAYELMLIFLALFIWPRPQAVLPIALGVFGLTCGLEFLQLWQPAWLQAVRGTLLGRLALGTTFSIWDFPAYAVGCCLGYPLAHWILALDPHNRSA